MDAPVHERMPVTVCLCLNVNFVTCSRVTVITLITVIRLGWIKKVDRVSWIGYFRTCE
jgi:hypothetical protein